MTSAASHQHVDPAVENDDVGRLTENIHADGYRPSSSHLANEPTTDDQQTQRRDDNDTINLSTESSQDAEPRSESPMLEKDVLQSFDPFRRRRRVWWLLALYLPLLVLPWVLTCIMKYRPLTARSYINQAGQISPNVFEKNESWQAAVGVMNTIAAVLTIPVTSYLLAEAAVIWSQRRRDSQRPLSLAHFFDLADRGWTDVNVVWREINRDRAKGDVSRCNWFLLGGAGFIVLCSVFLPLQQLLVNSKNIQVVTCNHVPYEPRDPPYPKKWPAGCGYNYYSTVSQDAQPGSMNILPLWDLKESVKASLITANENDHQSRLWTNLSSNTGTDDTTLIDQVAPHFNEDYPNVDAPFWITTVANGTTTGVLRQHAIRLNSSVFCQRLDMQAFPSTCAGPDPFTTNYTWNWRSTDDANTSRVPDFQIRVCLPGDYAVPGWNRTRDATTIMEEIYLGLFIRNATLGTYMDTRGYGQESFVQHCVVNTTRGYFELPNYHNDFQPQPLLQKFPAADEIARYNDYEQKDFDLPVDIYPPYLDPIDNSNYYHLDSRISPDIPEGYLRRYSDDVDYDDYHTSWLNAAGPLAVSAVAVFGNESFLQASQRAIRPRNSTSAALDLCQNYRMPFLSADRMDFGDFDSRCSVIFTRIEKNNTLVDDIPWGEDDMSYDITTQLLDWFGRFNRTDIATNAFGIATYYASEAMLTQGANALSGRDIYSSDGRTTQRPTFGFGSAIALSVILVIEVVGLLLLAFYSWKTPTYTSTLKSVIVAQLANAMDTGTLPPVGSWDDTRLFVLHKIDGRVGVASRSNEHTGKGKRDELVHGGEESLVKSRKAYERDQ